MSGEPRLASVMRVLIADDEPNSIDLVASLLHSYCHEEMHITSTTKGEEVRSQLLSKKFEVAFLDIEFGSDSIFTFLKELEELPKIVFISAHDHYALEAIKHSVFDYLLKPIDPDEFQEVVERLGDELEPFQTNADVDMLQNILQQVQNPKVAIPTQNGYAYYYPDDLIRIEAKGAYAEVFLANGQNVLVSRNLKDFERVLSSKGFVRIHRSHLVNPKFIKEFSRIDGGVVELLSGKKMAISRKYRESVISSLTQGSERI